jgi:septal ring factor EnvC (AmiA/AmiB activator)
MNDTTVNDENILTDVVKEKLHRSAEEKINNIRRQIKKKQDAIEKLQAEIDVLENKIKAIEEAENQKQLMALNLYLMKNNLTPAEIIKKLESEKDNCPAI